MSLKEKPLDQVHAIWEDRLAFWGILTNTPEWRTAAPELKDLVWEWAHEPVGVVDNVADRMRDSIHLLEGLRQ